MTVVKAADDQITCDGFLRGRVEVLQPASRAHRSGMDAVLLAASVAQNRSGRVADFGSGSGAAGLCLAALNSGVSVDLVERDPHSLDLARKSLALAVNRSVADRMAIVAADISQSGKLREAAGLKPDWYDCVIANPPFNDASHRRSPFAGREQAHSLDEGGLECWPRVAASVLKSGGCFSIILRPASLHELLSGLKGRFGDVAIFPVFPRVNEPAKRMIVRCIKGSRGPLSLLPGLVLHEADGGFTPLADDVFSGRAVLAF